MALPELSWPGEVEPKGRRLTDGVQPGDERLSWYVVRSATRQEGRAEDSLIELGFVTYAPRLTRWRRIAGRKVKVTQSLLPGYLFVGVVSRRQDAKAHDDALIAVRAAEYVHALVRASVDRPPIQAPWGGPDGVHRLLKLEMEGEFDKTVSRRKKRPDLAEGAELRVVTGMFSGFPTRFVEWTPDDRVKVLQHSFGRWVAMTFDADDVEAR